MTIRTVIKRALSIAQGGIFAFIIFGFVSCENFLNAGKVSEEIKDAIAYNNAKNIRLFFQSDASMGTFLSSGEKECKVGYTTEVQFTVNTESYVFKTLQAVSTNDASQSRNDFVQFTINEKESDNTRGVYKITIKLLSPANDILIQPVCIPLPAVISCKPQADKPAYANVPIEIEFNIPLEENLNTETGEALQIASQFNYDNIFLTVNGVSVNQYFEQPRFNFDKTILILKPDGRKFLDYIGTQSGAVVKVSFARNIIVQNDSVNLNFAKVANKSFSVQYKAEIDETAPTEQDFYVTAPRYRFSENSEPEVYESEPFSFKTIDNFINDNNNSWNDYNGYSDFRKNSTKDTLYIYGSFYDKEGIKSVTVTEKRIRTLRNETVNGELKLVEYSVIKGDAEFSSENSVTTFKIEHKIKSEDGAVFVQVVVKNNLDVSVKKELYIIKKENVVSNPLCQGLGVNYEWYKKVQNNTFIFDEQKFEEHTSILDYWFDFDDGTNCIDNEIGILYFRPNAYVESNNTVKCEYIDKNGEPKFGYFKRDGYFNILQISSEQYSSMHLKIIVYDEIGNYVEEVYDSPDSNSVVYSIEKSNNIGTVHFYNKDGLTISSVVQIAIASDGTKTAEFFDNNSVMYNPVESKIISGYTYKVIPRFDYNFFGDVCDFTYSFDTEQPENIGTVSFGTTPVSFSKNPQQGMLNVTVSIDENSWQNFDQIYVDFEYQYSNGDRTEREKVTKFFETDTLNCTFIENTDYMYNATDDGYKVTLYGIKSGLKSNKNEKTITKISGSDCDNQPPVLYYKQNGNVCIFKVMDYISSVKACTFKVNNKYYSLNKENDFTLKIPFADFDNGDFNIYYTISDIHDNECSGTAIVTYYDYNIDGLSPAIDSIEKNNTTWNIKTKESNYKYGEASQDARVYYFIDNGQKTWSYDSEITLNKKYITDSSFIYEAENVSFPENKLIKINRKVYPYYDDYESFSFPFDYVDMRNPMSEYFYTGSYEGENEYDLFIQNGKTKPSMAIASDAPVFVHTLITTRPYSECKNWSIKEWEYYRRSEGQKYYQFSQSDHTIRNYVIPMSEIYEDECYVVIAHFADNHVEMSEVMQK